LFAAHSCNCPAWLLQVEADDQEYEHGDASVEEADLYDEDDEAEDNEERPKGKSRKRAASAAKPVWILPNVALLNAAPLIPPSGGAAQCCFTLMCWSKRMRPAMVQSQPPLQCGTGSSTAKQAMYVPLP
jgi:hypothetical protein